MSDFLFRGDLAKLDPDVYRIDPTRSGAAVPQADPDPVRIHGADGSARGVGFRVPEYLCRRLP